LDKEELRYQGSQNLKPFSLIQAKLKEQSGEGDEVILDINYSKIYLQ